MVTECTMKGKGKKLEISKIIFLISKILKRLSLMVGSTYHNCKYQKGKFEERLVYAAGIGKSKTGYVTD